jgi:hypothetical protein
MNRILVKLRANLKTAREFEWKRRYAITSGGLRVSLPNQLAASASGPNHCCVHPIKQRSEKSVKPAIFAGFT